MVLEQVCPNCHGEGSKLHKSLITNRWSHLNCEGCRGHGKVLTEDGQQLIYLLVGYLSEYFEAKDSLQ